MSDYAAPLKDMEFVINELGNLARLAELPGFEDASADLVAAVLGEAGKLAAEVLAPLNRIGDTQGSRLVDGIVHTPDGWKDAYQVFVDGGWSGIGFDAEHGGQGLPALVCAAVHEMWDAANLSFSLCPMLTQSAAETIMRHGSAEQRARFVPKLISGEWAGAMSLTEPQAGSDLSAVRTRAIPAGDHYLLSGQKIYITYGDHDLTENIVHLVLARTPDAPPGVKGISLFIVPKRLGNGTGTAWEGNDVTCVSLEHKLGIHASPTAVLSYGERGGAIGYLVGQEHHGLEYMFTMMNIARHAVGLEGLAIAERARQQAVGYARQRIQGRPIGNKQSDRVPIIHHPDVRRMLLGMKAQIEAMRAVAYVAAAHFDWSRHSLDDKAREKHQARLDFLTPIVKGWCTELGSEIADLGLQVHGGMGYIEETGAAQHLRDARITRIYEGTTGIQANDLVGRKVLRDGAATARSVIDDMRRTASDIAGAPGAGLDDVRHALNGGIAAVAATTDWMVEAASRDPRLPAAAAVSYLMLWGTVLGGWQMARAAGAAAKRLALAPVPGDAEFLRSKLATARFYALHNIPRALALRDVIIEGSDAVLDTAAEPD